MIESSSGYSSYIFLDESGNLDFSRKGTKYFVLTSISMVRPFRFYESLDNLKYELLESGIDAEHFHCAEDNRSIRNRVFDIIESQIGSLQIDSLIVEKSKTAPVLTEEKRFYPEMLGYLLRYVLLRSLHGEAREVIVITDTVPIKRKRKIVENAAKSALKNMLPQGMPYRLLHHSSRSHYGLQIADYCSWAIFRRQETGKEEHYNRIHRSIYSEFDMFRNGSTHYY